MLAASRPQRFGTVKSDMSEAGVRPCARRSSYLNDEMEPRVRRSRSQQEAGAM